MVEHIYSILCERLLTDDANGTVTLCGILEKVYVEPADAEMLDSAKDRATGFAFPMYLVSWFVRTDFSKPETLRVRARWRIPGNREVPLGEFPISLEGINGVRSKMLVPGVPWAGEGRYWFYVDTKSEDGDWVNVTRMPLEVAVRNLDEQSISAPTAPEPPSEPTPAVPRKSSSRRGRVRP